MNRPSCKALVSAAGRLPVRRLRARADGRQPGGHVTNDFGISFREAVAFARASSSSCSIGVLIFLGLITLLAAGRAYVRRPGMAPLGIGLLAVVIVAQTRHELVRPARLSQGQRQVQRGRIGA